MRILIVDDHVLFREGLSSLFKRQPDFQVVGEAGGVQEAIKLARQTKPELILMDFSLPDGNGLDATQVILAELPDTQIVFLTLHEGDDRIFAATRMGAKGYLLKNLPVAKLLAALRGLKMGQALNTHKKTSNNLTEFRRRSNPNETNSYPLPEILTPREVEVFYELIAGESNQKIAETLCISEYTVKNHVHNILEKLNLQNRHEIINFAIRNALRRPQSGN
jgi:two-component system, NarL family, nitrate/nitrite response regulator NarL